jgi:hypothetical protein
MRSPGAYVAVVLSAIVVPCMLGHTASVSAQSLDALSASEIALACAPTLTIMPERAPAHPLRVVGPQDTVPRVLFGTRDLVAISGGTNAGMQLDQRFAIRRAYTFGHPVKRQLQTIHTTGMLRIVAVNEITSIAEIERVCDGVLAGDYLEPFVPPAALPGAGESAAATLDFSSLGRVLFGDDERRLAGAGDFMMLARGNAPLAPGTRVALYRDLQTPGVPLVAIGEGVIVSMQNDSPVMRVISARDAVRGGDYVVVHK